MKNFKKRFWENLEAILIALLIALLIKSFVFENYMVPTPSMVPTIEVGDRLIGLKFIYGAKIPFTKKNLPEVRTPDYGDIVVFLAPFYREPNIIIKTVGPVIYTLSLGFINIDPQPKYYVKRCIGLPGDKVQIIEKKVYVNERLQSGIWPEYHTDEWVIPPGDEPYNRRDFFGPVIVPEEHYFFMGDNRDNSFDSRYWGFVHKGDIFGSAFFRIWPISRMGRLK